jgi:hypothetical protein
VPLNQRELNAVYTARGMKRRYEVWFLRCGLADGSGAWWFRYLVMNLGRGHWEMTPTASPAQVWATWFPHGGEPCSFIQGFPLEKLEMSARRAAPFHCRMADNGIEEGICWGNLPLVGHTISWKLRWHSDFGVTLSDKGWIGFSRSPHSDAVFSGEINFDGRKFSGEPLGFGVQGHNCGYRHRKFWRWMHAYYPKQGGTTSTVEALVYDLPLGMSFRKAVLWHQGQARVLRKMTERETLQDANHLKWTFAGMWGEAPVTVTVEGPAPGIHRLPYARTDGSGSFPVANASAARATLKIGEESMETSSGAVVEFGGETKQGNNDG